MKRRMTTIIMAGLLGCLSYQDSYGAFSAFARIRPETEEQRGVYVQILPVDGQEGMCQILSPPASDHRHAHLITCREKAPT